MNALPQLEADELLSAHALLAIVPIAKTTIWRLERRGQFPRRISISPRRVVWRRSEVEAWLSAHAAARPTPRRPMPAPNEFPPGVRAKRTPGRW